MARDYDRDAIPTRYSLDDLPERDGDGVTQRFLRGVDSMVGVTQIDPHRDADPHAHPWEQLTVVRERTCRFHVDGEAMTVEREDAFFVPPDVLHRAQTADEPCTLLFAGPLREDRLEHTAQAEFPPE